MSVFSETPVESVPVREEQASPARIIGEALHRKEDRRLVQGQGLYVDDVRRPNMLCVGFVRSVYPHAKVVAIDKAGALAIPGVIAVVGPGEIPELDQAMPELVGAGMLANSYVRDFRVPPHRLLPSKVSYVGEQLAVVIASTPYAAADGVAAVEVEYDVLPAITGWEQSIAPDAPRIHEGYDNTVARLEHSVGDVEKAFAEADIVFEERLQMQSLKSIAIECRGVVAEWDRETQTLNVWTTCHLFYMVRDALANLLQLPRHQVRVMSRDNGGSFGLKGVLYPEDLIVPLLAVRMGKPLRWSETRLEHMTAANHSGAEVHDVKVGAMRDGRITALAAKLYKDVGAYNHFEMVLLSNTVNHMPTHYRIPNMKFEGWALATNTAPGSPFRGAGRVEATFTMDRVLDAIAQRAGLDPADVRRANLIHPEELPYRNGLIYRDGVEIVYEDVDFPHMFETALVKAEYARWREQQAKWRREGRAIGIGISSYVEAGGIGPGEWATVRIDESGRVFVSVGVNTAGQSHETTLAQVCAEELGAPYESVTVLHGDTSLQRQGFGSGASRVAVNAGNAVALAAKSVRKKLIAAAAMLFDCPVNDVQVSDGEVTCSRTRTGTLTFASLAVQAARHGLLRDLAGPGLAATEFFAPKTVVWSSGINIAVIEIDIETGSVRFHKYVVVHDCGVPLNLRVVEGQIEGGFVNGLGIALGEETRYDDEGQVLSGSLQDYFVARADDVPTIEMHHLVFPSSNNPLGVKAVGESGPISPPAAIAAAIEDALEGCLRITRLPVTKGDILEALRGRGDAR